MDDTKSHQTNTRVVRVTITLDSQVYDEIKRVSSLMGIRPSTWISMVCTSKTNNVTLTICPEATDRAGARLMDPQQGNPQAPWVTKSSTPSGGPRSSRVRSLY